jgi:hypothetical protein
MERAASGGAGTVATASLPLLITGSDIAINQASAIAAGSMSAADFAKLATYPAAPRGGWQMFGLGTDGALVVNANTTATANLYPTTFQVTNNARQSMAGYAVFASVSITVDAGSFISCNGGNGQAGGAAGTSPATAAFGTASGAAGAGGTGAGSAGTNLINMVGGRGGAGGLGSSGAGGAAGTKTVPTAPRGSAGGYQVGHIALGGISFWGGGTTNASYQTGTGGGGGGGDGAVSGGGGGAGPQALLICAPLITMNGTAESNGGDGGSPASGNAGGGGPGGGGWVLTVAQTYAGSGTYRAIYGTPGTGFGTGANGSIATATNGVLAPWAA